MKFKFSFVSNTALSLAACFHLRAGVTGTCTVVCLCLFFSRRNHAHQIVPCLSDGASLHGRIAVLLGRERAISHGE